MELLASSCMQGENDAAHHQSPTLLKWRHIHTLLTIGSIIVSKAASRPFPSDSEEGEKEKETVTSCEAHRCIIIA